MLFKEITDFEIKYSVSLYLKAGMAEPGPPLGTVLGNLGVNASKFAKEFNLSTQGLPSYFKLKVNIQINENRLFQFKVSLPSTSYIISLLKFEETFHIYFGNFSLKKFFLCISFRDLMQLALFVFPGLDLKQSFLMCWGSAKSFKLIVLC